LIVDRRLDLLAVVAPVSALVATLATPSLQKCQRRI
jgi:hypothetical protein